MRGADCRFRGVCQLGPAATVPDERAVLPHLADAGDDAGVLHQLAEVFADESQMLEVGRAVGVGVVERLDARARLVVQRLGLVRVARKPFRQLGWSYLDLLSFFQAVTVERMGLGCLSRSGWKKRFGCFVARWSGDLAELRPRFEEGL